MYPNCHGPPEKKLITASGIRLSISIKSDTAKLMTSMFAGVLIDG